MKKNAILSLFLLFALVTNAATIFPPDTTIRYNNHDIVIKDSCNQMHISVYNLHNGDSITKSQKVYEGIYADGKEIERQYENEFEINIPEIFRPKKVRKATAHLSGFGMGMTTMGDQFLKSDGELGAMTNIESSLRTQFIPFQTAYYISDRRLSFISGMGFEFNKISFQKNKYLAIEDYKTVIATVNPEDEFKKSRLRLNYITFPLLIETNVPIGHERLFINGGVVMKGLLYSASIIKNQDNKQIKVKDDLNARPITMDFIVQAGVSDVGFFATYSPFNTFRNGKGPSGKQASIGLQIYF